MGERERGRAGERGREGRREGEQEREGERERLARARSHFPTLAQISKFIDGTIDPRGNLRAGIVILFSCTACGYMKWYFFNGALRDQLYVVGRLCDIG